MTRRGSALLPTAPSPFEKNTQNTHVDGMRAFTVAGCVQTKRTLTCQRGARQYVNNARVRLQQESVQRNMMLSYAEVFPSSKYACDQSAGCKSDPCVGRRDTHKRYAQVFNYASQH